MAATSLADIEKACKRRAKELGLAIDFRQSNHEGELVDWIQEARGKAAGIIINAGGLYPHLGRAPRRAARRRELPVIEVHLSNIFRREAFRHHSYVSRGRRGVICGLGAPGLSAGARGAGRASSARQEGRLMAKLDVDRPTLIRKLAELLNETGLTEIEYRERARACASRVNRGGRGRRCRAGRRPLPAAPAPAPPPRPRRRPASRAPSPRRWSAPPISRAEPGAAALRQGRRQGARRARRC